MSDRRRPFAVAAALAAVSLFPLSAAFAHPGDGPHSHADDNPKPTLCLVTGETIKDVAKAAGKVKYKGKTYHFCCPGCDAKFAKADDAGKARFARLNDLRVEKVVLARRLEHLSADIIALEQQPAAEKAAAVLAKDAAAPAVAVAGKKVYCAVTDEEIGAPEKAAGGTAVYNGKTYYFCCAGCKPRFEKDPARFAAAADKAEAARVAAAK